MMKRAIWPLLMSLFAVFPSAAHALNPSECGSALNLVENRRSLPNLHIERCDIVDPGGQLQAIVMSTMGAIEKRYGARTRFLQIFRGTPEHWTTTLIIDRNIKNPYGYLAADYLDVDACPIHWITVTQNFGKFIDITLQIHWVGGPNGVLDKESLPVKIAWNPKKNRFQELDTYSDHPEDFIQEKSSLPSQHLEHCALKL